MQNLTEPATGFDSTGLSPVILSALTKAGFTQPTPIQAKAIPIATQNTDLIGIAATGTGKTMAFALPILNRLYVNRDEKALIVVPTRELALQVEENIRKVSSLLNSSMRTVSLIGGIPIYRQIRELKNYPRILIATPGRLRDHLDQKTVELSKVAILVLDEADRMLDMGFAPQINYICSNLPVDRQTMLFSATLAPEVSRLAATYLNNPTRVEVAREGTSASGIAQELCYVSHENKPELLTHFLAEHQGTVLVFSRTKHGATKLAKKVQSLGHTSAEIHSNRSLGQRRQALDGFKNGKYRVLVATDVASRGIDVRDIELVINYDLPDASEDYVHRIGRTGRAGKSGKAISFATHDQQRDVQAIERLIGRAIPLSEQSDPLPTRSFRAIPPSSRLNQTRSFNRPMDTRQPQSSQQVRWIQKPKSSRKSWSTNPSTSTSSKPTWRRAK